MSKDFIRLKYTQVIRVVFMTCFSNTITTPVNIVILQVFLDWLQYWCKFKEVNSQ